MKKAFSKQKEAVVICYHIMRSETLEHIVISGKINEKNIRGRQWERIPDTFS